MPKIPDEMLLSRLKKEDSASYELLYKRYFPSIANYIRQNRGSLQDAEDIFQESVIVLLGKVRQSDFVLTCSLKTFLFSISQNIWLKKLRHDKKSYDQANLSTFENRLIADNVTLNDTEGKLSFWLDKITANCRQILKAIFFFNEPLDSLMKKMGWKNKHTASNQKYKCIEQVRKESKK